jgi:hypothetical protein
MAATASRDSIYVNNGLFLRSTEDTIRNERLLDVSLTSVFCIDIKASNLLDLLGSSVKGFNRDYTRISFLAYEAVLPGRSFQTGEVINSTQGVTEKYPIAASYPEVDISFYVTRDYDTLTFFSAWMEAIAPVTGKASPTGYMKFRYPDDYECNVNIVKYERDMRYKKQRLTAKPGGEFSGGIVNPSSYTHSLINAYPINIISIPLSYNQSDILRTTITFNYDRYFVQKNNTFYDDPSPIPETTNPANQNQTNQNNQTNAATPNTTNRRNTINQDLAEIRNLQEASRLRQAGFSPGLGQEGRFGPGF